MSVIDIGPTMNERETELAEALAASRHFVWDRRMRPASDTDGGALVPDLTDDATAGLLLVVLTKYAEALPGRATVAARYLPERSEWQIAVRSDQPGRMIPGSQSVMMALHIDTNGDYFGTATALALLALWEAT